LKKRGPLYLFLFIVQTLVSSIAEGRVSLPQNPISPTSIQECRELESEYRGLWSRMHTEYRIRSEEIRANNTALTDKYHTKPILNPEKYGYEPLKAHHTPACGYNDHIYKPLAAMKNELCHIQKAQNPAVNECHEKVQLHANGVQAQKDGQQKYTPIGSAPSSSAVGPDYSDAAAFISGGYYKRAIPKGAASYSQELKYFRKSAAMAKMAQTFLELPGLWNDPSAFQKKVASIFSDIAVPVPTVSTKGNSASSVLTSVAMAYLQYEQAKAWGELDNQLAAFDQMMPEIKAAQQDFYNSYKNSVSRIKDHRSAAAKFGQLQASADKVFLDPSLPKMSGEPVFTTQEEYDAIKRRYESKQQPSSRRVARSSGSGQTNSNDCGSTRAIEEDAQRLADSMSSMSSSSSLSRAARKAADLFSRASRQVAPCNPSASRQLQAQADQFRRLANSM
jgi:hypothetical protein